MIIIEFIKNKIKNNNRNILLVCVILLCCNFLLYFVGFENYNLFEVLNINVLMFFSSIIAIYDLKYKKIKNNMLIYMLLSKIFILILSLIINFNNINIFLSELYFCGLGGLFGGGFFMLFYIISKKGIGGGDVKFIFIIGLYAGLYKIYLIILLGTLIAAIVGIILVILKKLNKKDSMPLAPFLFLGIFISFLI